MMISTEIGKPMQQLTIQRVMLVTLFALLFSLATRVPLDTDTWWHIRSGEHTLNEGMIYEDPFSHTRQGEDWTNHSWGSQIILYGVYEIAGDIGLALYVSALATAGMAFVYMAGGGNVYLRSFVVILAASAAAVFWSPRPHMLSFFLSAVFIYVLYQYKREGKDRLWVLPVLMLIWGNLHAGFSIGFIFMGGFIAGEVANNLFNRDAPHVIPPRGVGKLVVIALICVAVLVVNPYGLAMLRVPFETVSIGALRQFIQEWQSPNFQERQTWPFIFLLILAFGMLGTGAKRLDWTDFVLMSGTLFMALLYGRNIAVFAVAVAPALTFHGTAFLKERGWELRSVTWVPKRQARLNAGLLTVILLGALLSVVAVLQPSFIDRAQRQFLPVRVVEFIEAEQPPGPMFNSYNWGGYMMFALPEYPVYVDGRTDLYRSAFFSRYLKAATGQPGWQAILDEDEINLVVVERGSGLDDELGMTDDWTLIYPTGETPSDDDEEEPDTMAVVYVRNDL
jgi:hypothetical protein